MRCWSIAIVPGTCSACTRRCSSSVVNCSQSDSPKLTASIPGGASPRCTIPCAKSLKIVFLVTSTPFGAVRESVCTVVSTSVPDGNFFAISAIVSCLRCSDRRRVLSKSKETARTRREVVAVAAAVRRRAVMVSGRGRGAVRWGPPQARVHFSRGAQSDSRLQRLSNRFTTHESTVRLRCGASRCVRKMHETTPINR